MENNDNMHAEVSMFERFTQKARRIIFFARYEAAHAGSDYIEPVHLLMGLLREDRNFTPTFFERPHTSEQLRLALEAEFGKKESEKGKVDLPLAYESKKYISQAVNLADTMHHRNIEPKHFLLAFLSVPDGQFIQKLAGHGVRLEDVMRRVQEETEDTDYAPVERLPFHLSILRRIECANRESIAEMGRLLVETIVTEGHDEIIAAWRSKAAWLGVPEGGIAFVEYDLLIQKQVAAEKATAQSE